MDCSQLKNKNESNLVTKSNSFIRSHYGISLNEKRLLELIVSKINPLSFSCRQVYPIEISMSDYNETFNLQSSSGSRDFVFALDKLLTRFVKIKNGESFKAYPLLSSVEYKDKQAKAICKINQHLNDHFIELKKGFTSYSLSDATSFQSFYTWRLYELALSWKTKGCFEIKIEDLKNILEIPSSYRWTHIKSQIIDYSLRSIFKDTQLLITYQIIKLCRKIFALKFKICGLDK